MPKEFVKFIPFIVAGIIIVVLVLLVSYAIRAVKRGIRRAVGAVGTISSVANMVAQEANNTPRQLQNLTSTYTSIIKRDFPEFDAQEFLSRAENVLLLVLNSIESTTLSPSKELSENLRRKVSAIIEDIKSKGERWFYDNIHIHKSCISKYSSNAGSKIIRVEISIEYAHGIEKDGKLISGSRTATQHKYAIEAVYIQDVTKLGDGSMKGHNCPNCGAPVKQVGDDKFCVYCGTGLKEVNVRIWTFDNYSKC